MIARLQEWFQENPRARPLLMFALFALFCLSAGIWLTARKPSGPTGNLNRTPAPLATSGVPTLTGGEEPQVRSPRTAWVQAKDTLLRERPDLQLTQGLRTLQPWEEVFHLEEQDQWDRVRVSSDGTEGWVRNREITFTRPANLDQPTPAEVAVMQFYAAVVRRDYTAAYHFLAGEWRNELDFESFVAGYSRTNSLRTTIDQVIPMGENRYQVDVGMVADEMGTRVDYIGSYLVEKLGEDWLMTAGSLTRKREQAPRPVTPEEPVPVIETQPADEEQSPAAEELPDTLQVPETPVESESEVPAPVPEDLVPPASGTPG